MKNIIQTLSLIFFVNAVFVLSSTVVFAEEGKEIVLLYDDPSDLELSQKARMKLYPGGKDEGDIKVQTQLVQPQKKFGAQPEEYDAAAADD